MIAVWVENSKIAYVESLLFFCFPYSKLLTYLSTLYTFAIA